MKKRLFSLALASVMALSLAGCGGSKEAATEAETKAETEQTAADTSVKAEDTTAQEETKAESEAASEAVSESAGGTLIVGFDQDFPPMGFMGDNGEYTGFDLELAKEVAFLERIKAHLEDGKLARSLQVDDEDEQAWIASYNLLTYKPVIYAANVSEDDLADDGASNAYVQQVREYAASEGSEVFVICAQIEEEISQLEEDEKAMFLEDLGLKESGLEKLIKASYHLLGLLSFLTSGEDETRAWTIKAGTKAPQAAGKIHTDFERGFIRAEVVNYKDLLDCQAYAAAREKGLVRLEGKDYVVKDGDVILFRFNV